MFSFRFLVIHNGLTEPELSVTVNYTYTVEESDEETQIADTCVIHISRNPEELVETVQAIVLR